MNAQHGNDYFIGLQLKSIGYTRPKDLETPPTIPADTEKLVYQWNENIAEIWRNSSDRLEQWFEVKQRPSSNDGASPLRLQMELTTDLDVKMADNALNFSNRIRYDKLKVWDSTGTELLANMTLRGTLLELVIEDRFAIYPLTIDPSFRPVDCDFG